MHYIGKDFAFSNFSANENEGLFENIDSVITAINKNSANNVDAHYATPNEFFEDVLSDFQNNSSQLQRLMQKPKDDDFFPNADDDFGAWSGTFASRPYLKGLIYDGHRYLNQVRKYITKALLENKGIIGDGDLKLANASEALTKLEEEIATSLHHDYIAGTATQRVNEDYYRRLKESRRLITQFVNSMTAKYYRVLYGEDLEFYQCSLSEAAASCPFFQALTQNKSAILSIFNPGDRRYDAIHIKVPHGKLKIVNEDNQKIDADIICDKDCNMYFADEFAALSHKFYKIFVVHTSAELSAMKLTTTTNISIGLFTLTVYNDSKTFGFAVCHEDGNEMCELDNITLDYISYHGSQARPYDGAYIFNPTTPDTIEYSELIETEIYNGLILIEIHIRKKDLNTKLKIFRHHHSSKNWAGPQWRNKNGIDRHGIEIETYMGYVEQGKNVILQVKSSQIKNTESGKQEFYTDSNGLYMLFRKWLWRPDINIMNAQNNFALNFFPVTSAIYIEDSKTGHRLTLMNDRSQLGSSTSIGEVELVINRATLYDDLKGLQEPLNDKVFVLMKHYLMLSNKNSKHHSAQRQRQCLMDSELLSFYSSSSEREFQVKPEGNEVSQEIKHILPYNVKIFLRPYTSGELVLRVQNMDESEPIEINLKDNEGSFSQLLSDIAGRNISIHNITEVSLTTAQTQKEINDLKQTYPWYKELNINEFAIVNDTSRIMLKALEIKSFSIYIE
jgi:hypothetical protein